MKLYVCVANERWVFRSNQMEWRVGVVGELHCGDVVLAAKTDIAATGSERVWWRVVGENIAGWALFYPSELAEAAP